MPGLCLSLSSINDARFLPKPAPGETVEIGGVKRPGHGMNGMSR